MPIRAENRARYPQDWKLRSYFVRKIRARDHCEWCGAENSQPHPKTGSKVVLTAAHIYDDRPEAASLLNLAALCQKCHNGHDATARHQRRKARQQAGQTELRLQARLDRPAGRIDTGLLEMRSHPEESLSALDNMQKKPN